MKSIKINSIYIGNINKLELEKLQLARNNCSFGFGDGMNYVDVEKAPYKENAMLIKISEFCYIDFDKVCAFTSKINPNKKGLILGKYPIFTNKDSFYVDTKSLKPYKNKECKEEITYKELKKIRRLQKKEK